MSARLTSQLLVSALIRRVQTEGGHAMVLHKGEPISGAIMVQLTDRGENHGYFERVTDLSGRAELMPCGPGYPYQNIEMSNYLDRRLAVDTDIWVIELDIASGQQLAAEILCAG